MNAITSAHDGEPNNTVRVDPGRSCNTLPAELLRKEEAERLFEARLQWFLALSAEA